jgi:hypothetical protein
MFRLKLQAIITYGENTYNLLFQRVYLLTIYFASISSADVLLYYPDDDLVFKLKKKPFIDKASSALYKESVRTAQ